MRLGELRRAGLELLKKAGITGENFEAGLLIEHTFRYNKGEQLARREEEVSEEQSEKFLSLVKRRAEGYPLQYLLGEWEFFGLPFFVGEGVLPPRPDTEVLVEACLGQIKGKAEPRILDLCSGSGCIALALAANLPRAQVTAVELSPKAFSYLERNVSRHGNIVQPVLADVLEYPVREACLDLVVCNPPYIPQRERALLSRETAFEPQEALFAEEDGLYFYKRITKKYFPALVPGGFLAYEIGFSQEAAVTALLKKEGFEQVRVQKDYAGLPRVVMGRRPANE